MQKLAKKFGDGQFSRLKMLHGIGKHLQMQTRPRLENIAGAQTQHNRQGHAQHKKAQGRHPHPMHLLVLAQIGNAHRNGAKHQRNQHHFQQINKQSADQIGDIHRTGKLFTMRQPAKKNAQNGGNQDLGVEARLGHGLI